MTRPISEYREALSKLCLFRYGTDVPSITPLSAALDELEAAREQIRALREALAHGYDFHKRVECISEGREECSCVAFNSTRAALSTPTDGSAG